MELGYLFNLLLTLNAMFDTIYGNVRINLVVSMSYDWALSLFYFGLSL